MLVCLQANSAIQNCLAGSCQNVAPLQNGKLTTDGITLLTAFAEATVVKINIGVCLRVPDSIVGATLPYSQGLHAKLKGTIKHSQSAR